MASRIIKIGDSTAIVCGVKLNHTCNTRITILLLSNGDRVVSTPANRFKYENDVFVSIVGESLACDICGKAVIDTAHLIDE